MSQKSNTAKKRLIEQICEQAGATLKDLQPQQYPWTLKRAHKENCATIWTTHTHTSITNMVITEAC